jgi:hypothetical protein
MRFGVDMLLMPRAHRSDLPALLAHLDQCNETVKRPTAKMAGRISGGMSDDGKHEGRGDRRRGDRRL